MADAKVLSGSLVKDPRGACHSLLSIDPGIIYVSILSLTGEEIGSAAKPSASAMIQSGSGELTEHLRAISSIIAQYRSSRSAMPEAERLFGEFKNIIVTFGNLKVIVMISRLEKVMIALITVKDADEKRITFQSSKIISG